MTIVNVHVLLSGHQAGKCSIDDYEHRLERQCHKTNTNVTKGPFGYIDVRCIWQNDSQLEWKKTTVWNIDGFKHK